MWIETRKLTGGSSNQLDMSKRGKRGGQFYPGSVGFFGVNPNNPTTGKSVNIELNGLTYFGNPVEYKDGNKNWRLLLKGVTQDGSNKLTDISRMQLGKNGGFVNRVLLFTDKGNDLFEMEILDTDQIDALEANSKVWAKMGNETTGRSYGFI